MHSLTRSQKNFVRSVRNGHSPIRAVAMNYNVAPENARSVASRLMRDPRIKELLSGATIKPKVDPVLDEPPPARQLSINEEWLSMLSTERREAVLEKLTEYPDAVLLAMTAMGESIRWPIHYGMPIRNEYGCTMSAQGCNGDCPEMQKQKRVLAWCDELWQTHAATIRELH